MWSVNKFSCHAYSLKLQNLQKKITEGKLVEMLAKRSKGKQRRNVKQFPCNSQVPPGAPRCPTGAPRVRATIHPNKGGWPPHLPPGAAGRKTASAAVALDWHIPALLHPGADLIWSSNTWLQRHQRETNSDNQNVKKRIFEWTFHNWNLHKDNLTILTSDCIQFLKANLALVMGT